MFKILSLMSLSLIGMIMLTKAQLAPKYKKDYNEVPGVLKLDTPWNLHNFAVKPGYSTLYGGPVEMPNAYKPLDTIKLRKPGIKIYPLPGYY